RGRALPLSHGPRRRGVSHLHLEPGRPDGRALPPAAQRRRRATCRTGRGTPADGRRSVVSRFLDRLSEQVLLCDGAMGSRVQAMDLSLEDDFWNQENCTEVLNLSRPDIVREIHRGYFEAGADMVETNTFGGSPITLGEFGLAERAEEINRRAAEIAREAAELFAGDGRDRFVLGSVGPGTRLPSLGHIGYDQVEQAFTIQARGLIAGGVDAILIETCQDPLQ